MGESVTHGISSAIKKTTATTLKQVQEQVAKTLPPADAKPTRRGERTTFASKLQGTLGKLVSCEKQKDTKSGPHSPHERIQKPGKRSIRQLMHCHTHAASRLNQAPTTAHAPACGQHTGHHIDVDVDGGDDVDVDGGDDIDVDVDGGDDFDVDVDGGDDVDVDVDGGDDFDVDVDGGDDVDVDVEGGDDV